PNPMGYEYRLHVVPAVRDLGVACTEVSGSDEWKQIPTSLLDRPTAIGISRDDTPPDGSWPHAADLYIEDSGSIYLLCHNQEGGLFLNALVEHLRRFGHSVSVDDDI
ncbi:MAG: hypothetical protein KJO07_07210, partial [Deltaproteobacteria bacterium]|nr:hypothetical protein [Deltaproteobacteria bacterium]